MLQRCHLVPDAIGGPDGPRNIVLLCARCHAEAPDVGDADYMLRWIGTHESWGNLLISELQAAIKSDDVTEGEIEALNRRGIAPLLCMGDLMREWAVSVGGKFSYATLAACAVELIRREERGTLGDRRDGRITAGTATGNLAGAR